LQRSLWLWSAKISILTAFSVAVEAQQAPAPAPASAANKESIADAWGGLLQGTIPRIQTDPALTVPQAPVKAGPADDFLNHVYFDTRTEYIRQNIYFTGNPTLTGVINTPPGPLFNPNGIPDPNVFQPSGNQLYSFMNFGTRGWISDRVNTHFSLRYRQDLTHVDPGSPELNIINTYPSNKLIELITANVEITGRPTDGWFAGGSIQLGRQSVYGAEMAQFDGASLNIHRQHYAYTLFAGRRFSYFSDPDQRMIGGGNFIYKFSDDSSLEYDGLIYIKASHHLSYRRRIGRRWVLSSGYKMIGGYPIDFVSTGMWNSSNGRSSVEVGFTQKLTDKDYFYDYTINARDLDPHNPLLRLYLGPQSPYSQFVVDARKAFGSHLRLGGGVIVRRLNDSRDQGPFDTSFEDYRVDAQVYPYRAIEVFLGYHQRDSDRLSPYPSADFFDVSKAGSTRIQDFTAEIGRTFGEGGRLTIRAGGFYRRMNFQDQFYYLENLHDRGLLGSLTVKIDARTRAYFRYDLDTDFFLFAPQIKTAQILRVGMAWRY
jgi:hypothetical protein